MKSTKFVNSEVFGEIESIEAPHSHRYGELTLSTAREYAALTQYTTDDDGSNWVSAGVVIGAFNDVLESSDVKDIDTLAAFISTSLTNGYNYPTVNRKTETVYYQPYE